MNRRKFIQSTSQYAAVLGLGLTPVYSNLLRKKTSTLTVLHTNDVHSRIDPFPADHRKFPLQGGVIARKQLIDRIRKEREHVLLLDAGDMMQGTPYFNFFDGELEIKMMDELAYDAGTIGNHDFDAGIENLAKQMTKASFPLLNCNYDLKSTPLEGVVLPFKILEKGALRIGITGVGIELEGLVPDSLYGGVRYHDPVKNLNRTAQLLKQEHQCDLVIVLSHLGLEYKTSKISDMKLAKMTENVDLILGGHTHSFLSKPRVVKNRIGSNVLINQVGWAGLILGRIDIVFQQRGKPFLLEELSAENIPIS